MAERPLLDPLANVDPAVRQLVQQKDDLIKQQQLRIAELELHVRPANFPPCFPLVSHDIERDIPSNRKSFVKFMFAVYFFTCFVIVANMCINFYIANQPDAKPNSDDYTRSQWMSLAYLIGIPIAFPLWYWPLYRSNGLQQSNKYVLSCIGLAIAIAAGGFSLLGLINYGSVGIIYMIDAYADKSSSTPGTMAIIMVILWSLQVGAMIYAFVRQVHHYRKDRGVGGKLMDAATSGRSGANLI